MNIRSATIAAVTAWLAEGYTGPVAIRPEVSGEDRTAPCCVVRISKAEPLAPGEPIWDLLVLIAINQDADTTAAADAESAAAELFEKMDPGNFEDFAEFCDGKGLAISAMYPLDSDQAVDGSDGRHHWQHILGVRIIACG